MSYELTSPPPATVFPLLVDTAYATAGILIRDYFAAAALPAVMAARVELARQDLLHTDPQDSSVDMNQESIAEECYELADALLAEREKVRDDV